MAEALRQKKAYQALEAQGRYREAIPAAKRLVELVEQLGGQEHPTYASILNNLAGLYCHIGEYAEAETLYKRALSISEKALGPNHPDLGITLGNLADVYSQMGEYAQAEALLKRSLAIIEKGLGPDNPNLATFLNNLAEVYKQTGRFAEAELLYKRSLDIDEKAWGKDHPSLGPTLGNLADLYDRMGAYSQAEALYKRSLVILEKAHGPDHPLVANYLSNLAVFYESMGAYSKSEALYKRSLAIKKKALGPNHPSVANTINNLAHLYAQNGAYDKAEALYRKSLEITEKAFGKEHPGIGTILNNLALLYDQMGRYADAEPLYKRSLAIAEKALGPDHPSVGNTLSNLAALYDQMGAYAQAEALYNRSLAIREKAFGPDHLEVSVTLLNMAQLYQSMGIFTKAESFFLRSLKISEKALGPDHSTVGITLNNLAGLYIQMSAYAKAEPLLERSLSISMKAFGPDHREVGVASGNLAELYSQMGEYTKAEPLFKRALTINEKALGPDHPELVTTLNNLAIMYSAWGKSGKAHGLHLKAQAIDSQMIDQISGIGSEKRTMAFLGKLKRNLWGAMSLVSQWLSQDNKAVKDAAGLWLSRKGVALEAQKRFQEALILHGGTEARQVFEELSRVRGELSRMAFAGPGKEALEEYRQRLEGLRSKKEALEAKLAGLSQAFAASRKAARADADQVARTLPKDSCLVDFARIEHFHFKAKGKEEKWSKPHYLAFIIPAGQDPQVRLVDLGLAEPIDNLIAGFKKSISNESPQARAKAAENLEPLGKLVFEPLRPLLGGSKSVFISPDGQLNLIPFEVLKGPDGRFLIEDFTFNYLAAGRDVAAFGAEAPKANRPLIMGDPDFDLPRGEQGQVLTRMGLKEPQEQMTAKRSADMGELYFEPLPNSRDEVEAVHDLLGKSKADLYTGKEALEAVLEAKPSPRILHLATHGFFLDDQPLESLAGGRGISLGGSPMDTALPKSPPKNPEGKPIKIENPLLRCGIALAGANRALKSSGDSQGLVTAEKILGLNLRGTELVVLSACDTGMGEVKNGEGVFGLRRALTQAGAQSLVMSMWSVPDQETRELMEEYYRNMLKGGLDRCQALRRAALKEMRTVRERHGRPDPFFWGAFVFLGQPSPDIS